MVDLPKNHIIADGSWNGKSLGSARQRIAIRPEDVIWPDMDGGPPVPFIKKMGQALQQTHPEDFRESEITYKELFLDTLGEMAAKVGISFDPRAVFHGSKGFQLSGSQSCLLRAVMDGWRQPYLTEGLGEDESINKRFKALFIFAFVGDQQTEPVFVADDQALRILENGGVHQDTIQDFFKGFMQMAGLAEHDYLHAMTIPHGIGDILADEPGHYNSTVEYFSLSMHAQVLAELFRQQPARKEKVLERAQHDFARIAEMQEYLLVHADTPQKRQDAIDVGQYLAGIYAHRLFRIVSPSDPDLERELAGGGSVHAAAERINLGDLSPEHGQAPPSVLQQLQKACEAITVRKGFGGAGIYEDIHQKRGFVRQGKGLLASNIALAAAASEKLGDPAQHRSAGAIYKEMGRLRSGLEAGLDEEPCEHARSLMRQARGLLKDEMRSEQAVAGLLQRAAEFWEANPQSAHYVSTGSRWQGVVTPQRGSVALVQR